MISGDYTARRRNAATLKSASGREPVFGRGRVPDE